MILHHFRKEFSYLRLRWFAFLALLGFDLAVNLEWLFPLRAGAEPLSWLAYMPWVLMLVGATLLGSCPEDKPGSDRSFISTRPLPVRDYWLARVALWLLLLVAPVVAQTALYLALSDRPMGEVAAGTWARAVHVVQVSAWVLPMTALWRRGEFWAALGILAAGWLLADRVIDSVALMVANVQLSYSQSTAGRTVGALLFAAGIAGMAWRCQSGRSPRFWRRVVVMLGLALLCFLSARLWPWSGQDHALDQALVDKLAPGLKTTVDLSQYEFHGFEDENYRQMFAPTPSETGAASVSVRLRPQSAVLTQEGHMSRSVPDPYWRSRRFSFNAPYETLLANDVVLRDLFPAGTLFLTSGKQPWGMYAGINTYLAGFKAPYPNPEKPLQITTEFEVDWHQRLLELEIPLKAGSTGQSADHAWRILHVETHKTENGTPALGQVSVDLHVQSRGVDFGPLMASTVLLWSPQRRLVWLDPAFKSQTAGRAGDSGWSRHTRRLSWSNVLNYADGEDARVDVSQLRLVLLRNRLLGTSGWTWKSPDIRLGDHPPRSTFLGINEQPIYAGRELKAFQERLATLKVPTADSSEAQARRYLYDLVSLAEITDVARRNPRSKEWTETFRPLLQHHLPLMLELPASLWPGWDGHPPKTMLDEYLTEAQRDIAIDMVMTNPVLTGTVLRKGWAEPARRLQPRLLSLRRLPAGADQLLLKWGDVASHEKLMQEQRHLIFNDNFEELDKVAGLRPRLEALARDLLRREVPTLGAPISNETGQAWRRFKVASDFGDPHALDVCLRWLAMGGDLPANYGAVPRPNLLQPDGSEMWNWKVDSEKQWPRYRHLKAADFDYLPEKRAWKLRQP
ncbi:MAG: hypothetical protein ACO1TE_08410 [Prosthecobacter sp.]